MTSDGPAQPEVEARRTGFRTFLIADVRGYTAYTRENGDEAAAALAATFAKNVREVVSARDGYLLELRGDEALVVFDSPRQALRTAIELQERFKEVELPRGVGIGLDAGEAVPVEGGYRGGALNLAARLCAQAQAGEISGGSAILLVPAMLGFDRCVATPVCRSKPELGTHSATARRVQNGAERTSKVESLIESAAALNVGDATRLHVSYVARVLVSRSDAERMALQRARGIAARSGRTREYERARMAAAQAAHSSRFDRRLLVWAAAANAAGALVLHDQLDAATYQFLVGPWEQALGTVRPLTEASPTAR